MVILLTLSKVVKTSLKVYDFQQCTLCLLSFYPKLSISDHATLKADFLSWQKPLASQLRVLADNFSLLPACTTASTRCLVQNFQLICYSQRVNATRHNTTTWQFEMFKMAEPGGIVAVVKHCWHLVKGRRGCRERSLNTTTGKVFKKILACSVSRRVIVIA